MTGPLFGVDVHPTYQRGIDFPTLAREGYSFAVVKATEGVGYVAPDWDDWVRAARDAGLIPGAYHWLRAGDGAAQCRYFLDQLAKVGGPEGLLIQLDVEQDGKAAEAEAWLDEWVRQGHGDHPVLIYSGAWWWRPTVGDYAPAGRQTPRCLSWHSNYVSGSGHGAALYDSVVEAQWQPGYGGWDTATILQYSSRGTAGGLVANVDVNAFRGTRAQLQALTGTRGEPMSDLTDYGPWGRPPGVGERTARVEIDDLWGQEQLAGSPYDGAKSPRTMLLERVDAAVAALLDRPAGTVELDPAAEARIVDGLAAKLGAKLDEILAALAAYRAAEAAGAQAQADELAGR